MKEEIKELEAPKGIDFSQLSDDDILQIQERLSLLKKKEVLEIVNDSYPDIPSPKERIFTIKAVIPDDAMHENGYILGKTIGIFPFKIQLVIPSSGPGTYLTGFNEDDYLRRNDLTKEEKSDIIKEMRTAKVWLERHYSTSLDHKNAAFWKTRNFILDSLDPIYSTTNPEHLMLYFHILGGAYNRISPSYDKAKETDGLIYMSILEQEAKRSFAHSQLKLTANSKLADVMNNWATEDILFLIGYVVKQDRIPGYTTNTPKEILIEELVQFIDGADTKNEKKKRPQEFLDGIQLFSNSPDRLKTTSLIKTAIYYGFIAVDAKRNIINRMTGFNYGTNLNDAVNKLLDLKNLEELSEVKKKVLQKWK